MLAIEIGDSSKSPGGVHDMLANDRSEINNRGEPVGLTVPQPADKTMFLRQGGVTVGVGMLSALLMQKSCSCAIHLEPNRVHEWLLLIIAMMCLSFGVLLLAIGTAVQLSDEIAFIKHRFTQQSRTPK
jgi:hypothetical protein